MQHMHHRANCDDQHMCVAQYVPGWLIIHLWVYSFKRTVAMAALETTMTSFIRMRNGHRLWYVNAFGIKQEFSTMDKINQQNSNLNLNFIKKT